jgi:acetyl esterase/lipase
MNPIKLSFLVASFLSAAILMAELKPAREPVASEGSKRTYIFKTTPQGDLKANVYLPPGWTAGQKNPAIVMIHGGGFTQGSPNQFTAKAEYLASRGMVAVAPEYRLKTKPGVTVATAMEDGKSAIRWVRMNAKKLGIDPDRIVGAGGSAGGTCEVMAAMSDQFEPDGEDKSISSKPNVLVLYNPALRLPNGKRVLGGQDDETLAAWKVGKSVPPMILFFGTVDPLAAASREMARQAAAQGNRVEFYTAEGQKHGFFNDPAKGRGAGWPEAVLYQTDLFLESLGYLKGPPTLHQDAGFVLKRDTLSEGGK